MSEPELSKRIDDLHRRFDDVRADQLQIREEIARLRQEIAQLRDTLDRRFTLMIQVVVASMTLLGLLMTAYRFLRL